MNIPTSVSKSPWIFFLLVFTLSVPFWLIDAITEQFLQKELPINLPISALQAINPLIAASALVYWEKGSDGVRELLKRSVDYRRIKRKIWYIPILCLWPITMVLVYGLMYLMESSLPDDPRFPRLMVPVFFVVFLVSAAFEQVGWQGYAIDRLEDRWNALGASIIMGIVWAMKIDPDPWSPGEGWEVAPDGLNYAVRTRRLAIDNYPVDGRKRTPTDNNIALSTIIRSHHGSRG
jgi:uncharacterized protein